MKKSFILLSAFCFLTACAAFRSTYVVSENSEQTTSAPFWISPNKAHRIDPSAEAAKHLYFVGSAEDKSQRLCLKNAETDAFKKTAAETAKILAKKYSEIKKAKRKTAAKKTNTKAIREKAEQNILVFLQNDTVVKQYWERRDYMKEKGAAANRTAYQCHAVVKVKKTDLINAIEAYRMKTVKSMPAEDGKIMEKAVDAYIAKLKK